MLVDFSFFSKVYARTNSNVEITEQRRLDAPLNETPIGQFGWQFAPHETLHIVAHTVQIDKKIKLAIALQVGIFSPKTSH